MEYLRWSDFLGYIIIRCQGVNVKPIRWPGRGVGLVGLVKIRAKDQTKRKYRKERKEQKEHI